MHKPTPVQKLDFILLTIKTEGLSVYLYPINKSIKIGKYSFEASELSRILSKLLKDGYVDRRGEESEPNYIITFDGYVFIGYEKQQILDNETIEALSIAKQEAKDYSSRLLLATWSAGIAAVLLLLWQVWIWFYPVHANYPYWFWQK